MASRPAKAARWLALTGTLIGLTLVTPATAHAKGGFFSGLAKALTGGKKGGGGHAKSSGGGSSAAGHALRGSTKSSTALRAGGTRLASTQPVLYRRSARLALATTTPRLALATTTSRLVTQPRQRAIRIEPARPRWRYHARMRGPLAQRGMVRAMIYAGDDFGAPDLLFGMVLESQAMDDPAGELGDRFLDPSRIGLLELTVDPPDADIYLDGELVVAPPGAAPGDMLRLAVGTGTHSVEVARDGKRPRFVTFFTDAARAYTLQIALSDVANEAIHSDGVKQKNDLAPSILRLTVPEPGVEVLIDGESWGVAEPGRPGELTLPAGKHALRLTKAGYHDWRVNVGLPAGAPAVVAVVLEAPPLDPLPAPPRR